MLTSADITGIVGIVPTPGTPNAGDWRAENTVDLVETEKMIDGIVAAGTDIVMTTGTFGQGATLTWDELRAFVDCVVQTARGRAPIFAGVTTLNTRDTIARARALLEIGATGIFCGRPMWIALDDIGIVEYYRDLAEALPGIPLVIYDNPDAFKGPISPAAYEQLAKIPQIVASKHASSPTLESDLVAVGDRIRILPLETHWYRLAKAHPKTALACWSNSVACGPEAVNRLRDAISERDWTQAEAISERINWAAKPMFEHGLKAYIDYSVQLGHVRFAAAGFINPGPTRPPYRHAPENMEAGSRESGRRLAQLREEFAGFPAGAKT
jgi:4-(2-carboxyphenyl)-2-oxobut-3-enoate aldolase